jgi:hypothetical protein
MTTNAAEIAYQTKKIQDNIATTSVNNVTYQARTNYQMQMYHSVKYLNQILLVIYIFAFVIIKTLMIVQYSMGVKRDESKDFIGINVFFFYPYVIYYLELTIYFIVSYLASFIYGQSYVYRFDQIFTMTDFYKDPGSGGADWKSGSE